MLSCPQEKSRLFGGFIGWLAEYVFAKMWVVRLRRRFQNLDAGYMFHAIGCNSSRESRSCRYVWSAV
jgi:hypothetical protein